MIHLSKKEDYAVILVNELAINYNKKLVPLSKIAKKYSISVLFLRNLAQDLKKSGIIKAVEGKSGGYYLVKNPSKIKMGDILNVFSKEDFVKCCSIHKTKDGSGKCSRQEICIAGNVWRRLNREFMEKIIGLSLQDFLCYYK